LADQRYVTLILRLVLDRDGRLIRGEVGGTEGGRWVRFARPTGLRSAVESWLHQESEAHS
jgi:hypothetical protein